MRLKAIGCLAIGVLSLTALGGCKAGDASGDPRTEAQLVLTATVEPAASAEDGYTGVVEARVQSNLGFRVPGKITERLVDAGQVVKRGQPLMRIDAADYVHAETAQADAVAAAQARLAQAAADEARFRDLVDSGAVSKSAYDQAKAAAESDRDLLSAAQAELKVARDARGYSTLIADADGVVVETLAEPGQYVAAGQVVMRLAHAGPREAAVNLPEIVRPAIGSAAAAALFGAADRSPARLRQLSDAADPQTRTFEARYVLGGAATNAPLGATVSVYLARSAEQGLAVPLAAIDDEGRGPGVWTIDRRTSAVSFRPVAIARLDAERAILARGVARGELIVALGGHFLREGERVRLGGEVTPQ
jgi:RND family efflux transporter MFP subunit